MSNCAGQVATCRSRQERLSWAGRAEQVAPSRSRPERPSVKGQLMAGSAKEVDRFLSTYVSKHLEFSLHNFLYFSDT